MASLLQRARASFVAGDLGSAELDARELRRSAKKAGDLASAGRARALLAEIAFDRLRYVEARDELLRALSELSQALPATDPAVRQAQASLAVVLRCLDDFPGARSAIHAATDGLGGPVPPLDVEWTNVWTTLAVSLEHFDQARARSILETVVDGGLDPSVEGAVPALATANLHLASVVAAAGDDALALRCIEQCIELRARAFGPKNKRVAAARFSLARHLTRAGDIERARAAARDAMAVMHELGAGGEPRMSAHHATLGVAELIGGDVEAGTRHLETACAIEEKTFGASSPHTASMLVLLIQVHAGRRNWGKVQGLCARAIAPLGEVPSMEDSYALACELESMALLGLGRPKDATQQLRRALDRLESRATLEPARFARLWAALGRSEMVCKNVARATDAFERARVYAAEAGESDALEAIDEELVHARRGDGAKLKGQS